MRYSPRIIRNLHFWMIILLFLLCLILHYPAQIPFARNLGRFSLLGLERHALERVLFLAPITYTAFIFGLQGGMIGLSIALALMLPRVLFISPYPKDAAFETLITIVIGGLINGWLESRRREIGKREQTILKLEAVRRELQRIGKRFQEIFEKAHDAIWIQDLEGIIVTANASCSRVTGYDREALIGLKAAQLFTQKGLVRAREVEWSLLAGETFEQPYEMRIVKKDGVQAIIMLTTSLLGDEKSPAFLHIARDITEERKLQHSLRLYTAQIGKAHEEERKRIARELHDDTIQTLVAISRRLDNLISSKTKPKKELLQPLQVTRKEIDESLIRMRGFIQYLRPPILEYLGLLPALRELVEQVQKRSGLKINFHTGAFRNRLGAENELLIYRIVQEALRNAWKHSRASLVELGLEADKRNLRITVCDNGVGFDLRDDEELLSSGKLGLMGMKERAHLLGGSLEISSKPGRGTAVILTVPA